MKRDETKKGRMVNIVITGAMLEAAALACMGALVAAGVAAMLLR